MTADLSYHQNVSIIVTWSIFDCEAIILSRFMDNRVFLLSMVDYKSTAWVSRHCEEEISSRFYRSCSDFRYDEYLLILATFSWLRKVVQRFSIAVDNLWNFPICGPFCFLVTQRSSPHDVVWRHKRCIQRSDLSHRGIHGLWRYLSVSMHAVIG